MASASGVYEGLIFDASDVKRQKLAIKVGGECVVLATNETLTMKQKINRTASFTEGTAAVAGESTAEVSIYNRFKEIEFGFTLASADGTFPRFTEVNLDYNDLKNERTV